MKHRFVAYGSKIVDTLENRSAEFKNDRDVADYCEALNLDMLSKETVEALIWKPYPPK